MEDDAEAEPEGRGGGCGKRGEEQFLSKGEMLGLGEGGMERQHRQAPNCFERELTGSGGPLEAKVEPVRIVEVELFKTVRRNLGWSAFNAHRLKIRVGGVNVGQPI